MEENEKSGRRRAAAGAGPGGIRQRPAGCGSAGSLLHQRRLAGGPRGRRSRAPARRPEAGRPLAGRGVEPAGALRLAARARQSGIRDNKKAEANTATEKTIAKRFILLLFFSRIASIW